MALGRKKTKKSEVRESVFKKEAYIPKKRLQKKGRTVPAARGQKGREEDVRSGFGRRMLVLLLWGAFWAEVMYVLLFAHFFPLRNITIERNGGSEKVSEEQIRSYLAEAWQGKWLRVIPKENLLFVRPSVQEARILARYPQFETVQITRRFPESLKVKLQEKPFQLLWCRKEDCFLVTSQGRAADATVVFQYPEEQGKIVRIQDTAEAPVQIGTEVLSPEELEFIYTLITDFPVRTGLNIEGALERPNIYAEEIRIRTNKEFAIFFNTELPVDQSLNHLMLILQKEIPEEEWDKIDYIDLRTENRIYYTRKDRAPEKTEEQIKREEEAEKKRKEEEEKNKE